jgi:outer membrane protein assembly factor BamB
VSSSLAPLVARGENWSQFRGANGDGVAADAELPVAWGAENHLAWKVKLPGLAWSQPVVWDDRVFVTTAVTDEQARPDPSIKGPGFTGLVGFLTSGGLKPPDATYRWSVHCLDANTGETVWEKTAREGRPTMQVHPNNTYATETPATDGERLIAYFGMMGVYCYDLAGELLWSRDLGAFPMQFGWGTGSSPVIHGDYVYIQCDNDTSSFLVALDKRTGEPAWRVERDEQSNWATPFVWKNRLRTELVTAGGGQMRSYDPKTGEVLWTMRGSGRTAMTPVGDDELLYVDSADRLTGNIGVLAALRPGASGEIQLEAPEGEDSPVAWKFQLAGSRLASPLVYQGCLYLMDNQSGIVRCLDAKTGDELYRKRLPGASGFTASPIASGGRVYFFDQSGKTIVVEAGPEFRVVATNDLGEMCWSSPAVAGERLLIRTVEQLYAVGPK